MVIGQRVAVEAAWASTAATRWVGKGVRLCGIAVAALVALDSALGAALGADGLGADGLGADGLAAAAAEAVGTNSGTISISRTGLTIDSR